MVSNWYCILQNDYVIEHKLCLDVPNIVHCEINANMKPIHKAMVDANMKKLATAILPSIELLKL